MNKMLIKKIMLCVAILMFAFIGLMACGKENPSGTYTVRVMTENGKPLEEVGVFIYKDAAQEDLVCAGETDEEGLYSFESEGAIGKWICLKDVPKGYQVTEGYEISSQDVRLELEAKLLSEAELEGVTFQLGDVFADVSFVTPDGKNYTISELLKEKKAVILNFWYLNCGPCKMEFPYLQEAYEQYSHVLEVIAINPLDGTDATVADFQKEMSLTFPMAVADMKWEEYMKLTAYPTTVVIDRYGTIAMIHKGMITETETFDKIFDYFTDEDYEQTTIKKLSDMDKE